MGEIAEYILILNQQRKDDTIALINKISKLEDAVSRNRDQIENLKETVSTMKKIAVMQGKILNSLHTNITE